MSEMQNRDTAVENRIKVGLDLDDNLAITERTALTAAHAYCVELSKELGLPSPGDLDKFIKDHPGKTFRDIMLSICEAQCVTPNPTDLDTWVATEKSRIMAAFARDGLVPTPGTVEALSYFQEMGITHPIVTSSAPDRAKLTVEVAGLANLFHPTRDPIFSAQAPDFTGHAKPSPDIYNLAFGKYEDLPVMLVQEDSKSGSLAGIRAGAVVIGNVGAQATPEAKAERAKLLLDTGVSLVIENNASMIVLVNHLRDFDGIYTRDNVEKFLRQGNWLKEFAFHEGNSGRTVWLPKDLA